MGSTKYTIGFMTMGGMYTNKKGATKAPIS